jgi:hypothetical protein
MPNKLNVERWNQKKKLHKMIINKWWWEKTLIRWIKKSQLEGLIELRNSFNKKKKIKKNEGQTGKKKQQRILLNDEIERKKRIEMKNQTYEKLQLND